MPAQTIEKKLRPVPHIEIQFGVFSFAIHTLPGLLLLFSSMLILLTFGLACLLT